MAYLNPAQGYARQGLTSPGAPAAGVSEVQTLTIGGTPTSGTIKLAFDGATTAPIAWSNVNATLVAAVDAALEALPTIGVGGVTTAVGTMTAGIGTITITFAGALANKAVGLITVAQNALVGTTPTAAVTRTTAGVTPPGRGAPKGTTATRLDTGVLLINTGTATAPTWTVVGTQT